ncbi:hypothetical protein [Peribacillus frigoritolerans]|uniref:hypothetical protein n=1 Tax=Peribacillus frigoritolerans TaxID=450367 RepID=UPI0037F48C05
MVTSQGTASVSFPFPSVWGIHSSIAGRTIIWGTFSIHSIIDNRVVGTVNFRGRPIPINGFGMKTPNKSHLIHLMPRSLAT